MSRAKPVVCTELGTGVSWVNVHGETGLVVPPQDPAALRDAIERLLGNPTERQKMGTAAAERARSVFAVDRMVNAILATYHETRFLRPVTKSEAQLSGAKRLLDILLAGCGLIFSAPVALLAAVAIKLEDGGPIFFTQERVGRRGRHFLALKFRSMVPDAETRVGPLQAVENDARVTRVGRLMRATAMDELPQLWNIFRGDMSFVGPRALRPGEIEVNGRGMERLEEVPGFQARCAVVPGLTGVAQIYAPRDITRRHKFRYDRLYIRRQSFWLDVRLILLSFWITFRGTWEARERKF
jgi:lipopolysaccharide/colanic/teichoic acid biosynthesis glycosyltransferase